MKVLTIGSATQDMIVSYQDSDLKDEAAYPWKEGSKIEIKTVYKATGGGATNSAVSFSRLGFDTTTCFKIGNDAAGKQILQELNADKVQTLHTISSQETGFSFILPTPSKDRIIFTYRGANTTTTDKDIPYDSFGLYDCLYITSLGHEAAQLLPKITHTAQKKIITRGIKVVVNPGASQLTYNSAALKAALFSIDVLIMNVEEMKQFMTTLKPRFFKSTGKGIKPQGPALFQTTLSHGQITFTAHEYFSEILGCGVKRVVVTDGKRGVYVATKDTLYFHPASSTQPINTLGAGDAFGSCFVASLLQGKSLEDAIRCGIINAGSVIAHSNAKEGLLSLSALEKQLSKFDKSLLKTYSF